MKINALAAGFALSTVMWMPYRSMRRKIVVEVVDLEVCIECHSCQQMCPEKAIKVYPQIDEILPKL